MTAQQESKSCLKGWLDKVIQFSHSFDEQIGGQLKAGFVITAAYEDFNNEPDAITDGILSYWATKVVKLQ